MTMSGATSSPALAERRVAIMTEARGRRRTETQHAPTSAATAGVSEYPGRCAARSPATTPRKMAGNVGPPRKLLREMLQASPLKTMRSASADSEIVEAEANSEEKAVSPEKSTAFGS